MCGTRRLFVHPAHYWRASRNRLVQFRELNLRDLLGRPPVVFLSHERTTDRLEDLVGCFDQLCVHHLPLVLQIVQFSLYVSQLMLQLLHKCVEPRRGSVGPGRGSASFTDG